MTLGHFRFSCPRDLAAGIVFTKLYEVPMPSLRARRYASFKLLVMARGGQKFSAEEVCGASALARFAASGGASFEL